MPRLTQMNIREVSLVDRAANKRRFVLLKREDHKEKQDLKNERWEITEDISDSHIHAVASLDENGNGRTDPSGDPSHSHDIKEFKTIDVVMGEYISRHPDNVVEKLIEDPTLTEKEKASNLIELADEMTLLLNDMRQLLTEENSEEKVKSEEEEMSKKEKETSSSSESKETSVAETEAKEEDSSLAASGDEGKSTDDGVHFTREEWEAFAGGITELAAEVRETMLTD